MARGTITIRLNDQHKRICDLFGPVYDRSDFDRAFKRYAAAAPSTRPGVIAEICRMLKALNVPFKARQPIAYYMDLVDALAAQSPSPLDHVQLNTAILTYLCTQLDHFPEPERYMERLVDLLAFPEDAAWQDKPLRLRILLQCIKYGDWLTRLEMTGKTVILQHLQKRLDLAEPPTADEVLAQLTDGDIDALFLEKQARQKELQRAFNEGFDGLRTLLSGHARACTDAQHLPLNDFDGLQQAVGTLGESGALSEDVWAQVDIGLFGRPRLEKHLAQRQARYEEARGQYAAILRDFRWGCIQDLLTMYAQMAPSLRAERREQIAGLCETFCRHTGRKITVPKHQLYEDTFTARQAQCLQAVDALVSAIKSRYKEGTYKNDDKAIRDGYKLLTLADDLAGGKFKGQGATRRELYIFALLYNMTYTPDAEKRIGFTDVEQNLFEDYYQNNLLRTMTDAYHDRADAVEADPSGQGINFKSFEDVVFLYHIAKPYDHLPQAKRPLARIRDVETAFRQLRKTKRHALSEAEQARDTQMWEQLFVDEMLALSPQDFLTFVSTHFDCDAQSRAPSVRMQRSALQQYQEIIGMIQELHDDRLIDIRQQDAEDEGRYMTAEELTVDPASPEGQITLLDLESGLAFAPESLDVLHLPNAGRLKALLMAADKFLRGDAEMPDDPSRSTPQSRAYDENNRDLRGKWPWMNITDPGKITRTALVTAYYHYYQMAHVQEQSGFNRSFAAVYATFEEELRDRLDAAGYTPFSPRNLYDLLLVFSAYAYCNPF